jgi:hypothetical protein
MDSPNSIEFTMKKKQDAKTSLKRIGIFCACFFPVVIILAIVAVAAGQFFLAVTPVLVILSGYLYWYLMRFTYIEYEYVIMGGDFTISAIYNNLSRKDLIVTKVKDMLKAVPYHGSEQLLNTPDINQVLYYCSDLENPDLYIGIFDDAKKGRVAVIFNTSRKLVQILKFYNSLNVTVKSDFQI